VDRVRIDVGIPLVQGMRWMRSGSNDEKWCLRRLASSKKSRSCVMEILSSGTWESSNVVSFDRFFQSKCNMIPAKFGKHNDDCSLLESAVSRTVTASNVRIKRAIFDGARQTHNLQGGTCFE